MRRLIVLALVVPAISACAWSPFSVGGSASVPAVTTMATITIPSPNVSPILMRKCGLLAVGSGWRISSSVSCQSAMRVMRAFFHGGADNLRVLGYRCTSSDTIVIHCSRGHATVLAFPNH